MGRFATTLAAYAANVDNLPPRDKLPEVSFWDAVLPQRLSDLVSDAKKPANMGKFFNWPPLVAVALDADTGKPLDPSVGMKVRREFYNVRKDGRGKRVLVARHGGVGSAGAEEEGEQKDGNGEAEGDGGKKDDGDDGKKGDEKDGGEEKKEDKDVGEAGGEKKDADAPFTPEDDAVITRMKAEKKSWNDIIGVLGRNKSALQARWKIINPEVAGGNADGTKGGNGDGGSEGKKDPSNKQQGKKHKKKESTPQPPNPSPKAPSAKPASAAPSHGPAKFTMQEWMTLQEDEVFSFAELQCLSELLVRDERLRWMRLASAFFDRTGRRVHPEDVRERFGGVGR